jgi:glycerol kinase
VHLIWLHRSPTNATTIAWNRKSGKPICNAIVGQDTRVAALPNSQLAEDRSLSRKDRASACHYCGLKIRWVLNQVANARDQAESGEPFAAQSTVSDLNLTGGAQGGPTSLM